MLYYLVTDSNIYSFYIQIHIYIHTHIIIIIKELPQQATLKDNISLGSQEKRKDRKTRKSRSEEKVLGFSSASVFPARKRDAVTEGGTLKPGR